MAFGGTSSLVGCAWLAVLSRAPIAAATQPPAQAVVAAPAGSSVDVVEIGSAAIKAQTGLAYSAAVAIPEDEADGPADVRRSQWLLLEDDLPLGPGHCLPASIAADGAGRYSHWRDAVVFSSLDGSDPRTNGRHYTLVKPVDRAGHRIHFPGSGAILILHVGERLWWRDPEPLEAFAPRFGPRRLDVNPSLPRRDGTTLIFETPGEFGLRSPHRAVRVLVLHRDEQEWAGQIVGFVAANTTGGQADESAGLDGAVKWPTISRAQFHHLFNTEDDLDVEYGQSARLAGVLAESVGLKARYCGWIGGEEPFARHLGVEIYNDVREAWEYYDPHFGLRARDRASTLSLAMSLRDTYAGREAEAFAVLVDKIDSGDLARQWASFKVALQMWPDAARRTSMVLLLSDAIPSTLDPDQFDETEFLSASTDLAVFRARLYESAEVGADAQEPGR